MAAVAFMASFSFGFLRKPRSVNTFNEPPTLNIGTPVIHDNAIANTIESD
jgi:hypothetical protein